MSSSSGREKFRSRGPRVFAFGSSTPREFSQMTKVSSKSRGVDASDSPNLHEYIVKARSLSREATSSSDQRGGGGGSRFAFGSSTPRHLAHLDKIPTNQRVYDAKIPKKSSSNYDFKAQPIRYITYAPTPPRKTQQQHAEQRDNPTSFNHAPEIAGNARKSIRIRAETQDDSAMAVENVSANKMNDQIEVSQLNEMVSETEIGGKEEAQNSKVTGDLLTQIMHKLPAEEIDTEIQNLEGKINNSKNNVENKIEEISQKVENLKNATIDEVSKTVDNSAKNAIQKSIDIISTNEEKLDDTTKRLNDLHTNAEKSAIEELKNKASNIADEKLIKLEEKTENVVNDIKKGLTSL